MCVQFEVYKSTIPLRPKSVLGDYPEIIGYKVMPSDPCHKMPEGWSDLAWLCEYFPVYNLHSTQGVVKCGLNIGDFDVRAHTGSGYYPVCVF